MKAIGARERVKRPASAAGETGKVVLRPQQPEDEPFVFRLFAAGRPDLEWITGVGPDRKQGLLVRQFRCEQEQLRKDYPDAEYSIILQAGNPVGRVYLHRGDKEYRILLLTLVPEYRGRGIGGSLIKNILLETSAGNKPVGLQVAWYNHAARGLYERTGFRVTQDKGVYYEMQWLPETGSNE
jgi:ribosomal protein S18 acetylase RimI-like enzyme